MKAVITVTGKDSMGIIAKVSGKCSDFGANIVDISQSVMSRSSNPPALPVFHILNI